MVAIVGVGACGWCEIVLVLIVTVNRYWAKAVQVKPTEVQLVLLMLLPYYHFHNYCVQ